MHSRRTARAAVISTIVVALASVAGPAAAGHDEPDGSYSSEEGGPDGYGADERAGRGPDIDLQVGCSTVDVTAPRKISTVTVYFADGTEEIIEVDEREYSGTFDTTIDHATAESRKQTAVDHAQDCEPEPSASPSEPAPDDGSGGDGSGDRSGDGSDGAADGTNDADAQADDPSTRTSTSSGDGAGTGTRSASTSDASSPSSATDGSSATAPVVPSTGAPTVGSSLSVGGNAHVLGMVFHQGLKQCPSGPHKGMPYINIKECGDLVLGTRLSATGSGAGGFAVLGFGLIGLGALLLRLRRPSAAA